MGGTPKSSILIGSYSLNHPAIGVTPFEETPIWSYNWFLMSGHPWIPSGNFTTFHIAMGNQWEIHPFLKGRSTLVGGFNPSEKYWSVGINLPNIWKNKNCSKPPTRTISTGPFFSKNQRFFFRSARDGEGSWVGTRAWRPCQGFIIATLCFKMSRKSCA